MKKLVTAAPLLASFATFALLAFVACSDEASPVAETDADASAPAAAEIELVESWPEGTSLDHVDVRDAAAVWIEMIDRATTTLDFAEAYASLDDGAKAKPTSLAPVLEAVERAVGRGVTVRFLADGDFADIYADTLKRLEDAKVEVRILDFSKLGGDGLHAKYFVVDDAETYVGSQNFDWRALTEIREVGVRIASPDIAASLDDVFETDWALSAGGDKKARVHGEHASSVTTTTGEKISLVASPKGWLPDESTWELPRLEALFAAAEASIEIQVLEYSAVNGSSDGRAFTELDDALRAAAGRGVKVRLLVSHWAIDPGSKTLAALEALQKVENVEVHVITIPQKASGEIPYARVAHAKFAVFDRKASWIGTSNWQGNYFEKMRNVAIIAEGGALPSRLVSFFDTDWTSEYTKPLAPATE